MKSKRYLTKCYEINCPYNSNEKCTIESKDEFNRLCGYKIVEKHCNGESNEKKIC